MANMNTSIKTATDRELDEILFRLRKEREVQALLRDIKASSEPMSDYGSIRVSMDAPISDMYHEEVDNFLAHYGVIGMKWGVRRAEKGLAKAKKKGDSKQIAKASKRLSEQKEIQKMKTSDKIFLRREGVLANKRLIAKGETKAKRLLKLHGVGLATTLAGQKLGMETTKAILKSSAGRPSIGKSPASAIYTPIAAGVAGNVVTLGSSAVGADQIYKRMGR